MTTMFTKDFLIGASTAAHQVEGNNTNSDYWAMEQMEYSSFVEPSLEAVDHYNRFEEDIRMLAEAGLNAYRFSIEWARIEKEKDQFDETEVEHYRNVIKCCKKYGVEPIVTLHHFTSPKWLICDGGWDDEMVVERFAIYAKYIAEKLGSELHYICTINEANMRLQIKAISERFMKMMMAKKKAAENNVPQEKKEEKLEGQVQVGINLSDPMERMKLGAAENVKIFGTPQPHTFVSAASEKGDLIVCKAHQAAREAIKSVRPEIKVGLTLSVHDIQCIEGGEAKAKDEWEEEFSHYIPYIQEDDFFGLQNYTRSVYGPNGIEAVPDGAPLTQMDYEVYPEALEHVIRKVNAELPQIPIMITENGISTSDDTQRIEFIKVALCGVKNCLEDGIPVIGYCHWSLMDNFEWQKGYQMTFGLCAVDRTTQERHPKESLAFLGSFLKEDLKQMNKKQALNPFLPLNEYIPDGEPHVFGDRVYLYGSHDTEGGTRYCSEGNYVCYSAPVSDLTDWKYEGVIFEASQSPGYTEEADYDLYAPDVVQGNDGRYYLYYNEPGFNNGIYVAVCDTPAGKYEYYGMVKNPDGSVYMEYLDGDPAVLNDDGTIRLYCGWSLSMVAAEAHRAGETHSEQTDSVQNQNAQTPAMPEPGSEAMNQVLKPVYQMMFQRNPEETERLEYPLMGANTMELEDDMLTVKGKTHRIVPGQFDTPKDSSFYGHAFYEASSIRKINGMYYFIYSSENSNELCYATSKYPDRDFTYGGTIISNGDVGYKGRKNEDRLNMTANNHGSLELINGQWYVFYHRQTHNSTFSRQACAEPVVIAKDGRIAQVECTSCGLNRGPLDAKGSYPAPYACNLTNGHMPHATNTVVNADIPYITHNHDERFITNIQEGTMIGYKYFRWEGSYRFRVKTKGEGSGMFRISTDEAGKSQILGQVEIHPSENWKESETVISAEGVLPLYLHYEGNGSVDLLEIAFV